MFVFFLQEPKAGWKDESGLGGVLSWLKFFTFYFCYSSTAFIHMYSPVHAHTLSLICAPLSSLSWGHTHFVLWSRLCPLSFHHCHIIYLSFSFPPSVSLLFLSVCWTMLQLVWPHKAAVYQWGHFIRTSPHTHMLHTHTKLHSALLTFRYADHLIVEHGEYILYNKHHI